MVFLLILQALWFIFPAYVANASPVVIRGQKPLDFGKKLSKYRILGDGKTFEGTIGGIAFGALAGVLQVYLFELMELQKFGLTEHSIPLVIALSTGAIIGDIMGAFIKRRLGIARGEPALLLDQLDFLILSLIFASFVVTLKLDMIITLVIITPILHLATNIFAYATKMKSRPW
jgi:CDP-2,3-bis-(O-geranylgeranyl)-sn-glycerol synthase